MLRDIDVESYGMEPVEQMTAAAVKAHLEGLGRYEALDLLRTVMKTTMLKIPPLHEKPEILRTRIEGRMLSDLIDTAVAERVEVMKSRQGDVEFNRKIIKALEQVDGKMIVQSMSPEFLCFFTDCYKELRY